MSSGARRGERAGGRPGCEAWTRVAITSGELVHSPGAPADDTLEASDAGEGTFEGTTMKTASMLIAIAAATGTAGCASYVNHLCHNLAPGTSFVTFESTPPGAVATLSTGRVVRTPACVPLRADREITATFTRDGYQPATVQLRPGMNPWVLGDLIALPPIGFFIDAEQGAMSSVYPGTVRVALEKAGAREAPAAR